MISDATRFEGITHMVVMMWVNRNASYAICLNSLKLLRVRMVKPASPTKPYKVSSAISCRVISNLPR